jgi:hypothetical protein
MARKACKYESVMVLIQVAAQIAHRYPSTHQEKKQLKCIHLQLSRLRLLINFFLFCASPRFLSES